MPAGFARLRPVRHSGPDIFASRTLAHGRMAMATTTKDEAFMFAEERKAEAPARARKDVFRYGDKKQFVCLTEDIGQPKDRGLDLNEIWVGLGNVIPLWAANVTLYWRFKKSSFDAFANPEAAKDRVRGLLERAIASWGDACPVTFAEREQGWDFEIVVRNAPDCDVSGCVLASAFFPDAGQHKLTIYPTMFQLDEEEQIETLIHEIGHIFGLRHFFANVSETQIPAQLFGEDLEFTIMNYGEKSLITDQDRSDVRKLYELVRSGELKAINGTRVQLMKPFSSIGQ